MPIVHRTSRSRLLDQIVRHTYPRIALVKQDVNEDLYCCRPHASPQEIISSTLLRSGPVALFTKFDADFYVLETEPDLECNTWKEKAEENHWWPVERFEAYKCRVPGRNYGQKDFAVRAESIDWSQYELVISVDVSVPERITRHFPSVAWAYYIREVKTSSYRSSFERPVAGQDIYLSQSVSPRRRRPMSVHVVNFPYHFQYFGCFHDLLERSCQKEGQQGIFLEHHTVANLSDRQLDGLRRFGPVSSTAFTLNESRRRYNMDEVHTTMEAGFLDRLTTSKYFVKCGGRSVFGTAAVEAIAAGCLAIGNPKDTAYGFIYSKSTAAEDFDEVLKKISVLENDEKLCQRELKRQRMLVDYLCYARPALALFKKARSVVRNRQMVRIES
ncbi:MAG: hypothetical protein PHX83_14365 [Acidobacteriia bacterium]|nr:hypothetical protein [Terriglobia bacterium]